MELCVEVHTWSRLHERAGLAGGVDPDDRGQLLVGDPDPPDRVLGDVAVLGDDEGDRLAGIVDLVLGQRVLGAAVGERGVRDQQRQRLGHRCREAGEVVVGPHRVHALEVEDRLDVDVEDSRVGVRGPQDRGVQQLRADADVVDVPALPAQEPLVLDPLDLLAHQLRGHQRRPASGAAISAARSTALTMFW